LALLLLRLKQDKCPQQRKVGGEHDASDVLPAPSAGKRFADKLLLQTIGLMNPYV
jgi:hypothetical protein